MWCWQYLPALIWSMVSKCPRSLYTENLNLVKEWRLWSTLTDQKYTYINRGLQSWSSPVYQVEIPCWFVYRIWPCQLSCLGSLVGKSWWSWVRVPPEAANFSLKKDCFGQIVLCCFAFLLCCCCCLAFLRGDCSYMYYSHMLWQLTCPLWSLCPYHQPWQRSYSDCYTGRAVTGITVGWY